MRWILRPPATLAVLATDVAWLRLRAAGAAVSRWPPLARLQDRIGRLPAFAALPLFLVPELCSRSGWVVSAWLVLHGAPLRALAIYVATKLLAGSLALWICSACLPVLLRLRAFAACHGAIMRARRSVAAWFGGRSGRFGLEMDAVRARRVTVRSSAAGPVPAKPSVPGDPSRTA